MVNSFVTAAYSLTVCWNYSALSPKSSMTSAFRIQARRALCNSVRMLSSSSQLPAQSICTNNFTLWNSTNHFWGLDWFIKNPQTKQSEVLVLIMIQPTGDCLLLEEVWKVPMFDFREIPLPSPPIPHLKQCCFLVISVLQLWKSKEEFFKFMCFKQCKTAPRI